MFKEFKEFATRGSVIDLAIGVIIGSAFSKIVDSLVKDILMPPIGLLLSNVDFTNLFVTLKGQKFATLAETQAAGAVTLNFGLFINALISFLIVAFVIFLVVKQVNKFKRGEVAPPSNKECAYCFSSIPIKAVRCPNCTSQLAA
jgi:large conductance mechanosensitive channel